MTDREASSSKVRDVKYYSYATYTVTFSNNDTFTASEFVDTEDLKNATVVTNNDGTTLSTAITDNVITVSGSISNQECTVFVFGVKA